MGPLQKARKFAKALVTRTLEFEFERMPYRLENLSKNKLLTLFRSELNCARPRPRPPWYPVQLQVEPSSACTLRCPLCPSGMGAMDSSRRNMPIETFRALLDEVGDYAIIAVLWMWGEPFVNPRLSQMIAYAHSKNMATLTSTNGQHIRTMEDAETLVASGLDNLIVALDGATQETYSRYRVGGDIEKIFRCLGLIRQAKDSMGSATPRVNVRTVVNRHNEHELAEIEKIALMYGADMVSRKSTFMLDKSGPEADERFAVSDSRYTRFKYRDGKRVHISINDFYCRRPWNRLSVAADGTVLSCEFDYNHEIPFGRGSDETSFVETWRGREAEAFRRLFLADKAAFSFCADCGYRDGGTRECTLELKHLMPRAA